MRFSQIFLSFCLLVSPFSSLLYSVPKSCFLLSLLLCPVFFIYSSPSPPLLFFHLFCLFTPLYFQHVHHRVPGPTNATSSPLPPAPAPAPAPNPEPSTHSWATAAGDGGRLSSDEGDAETPEDTDTPAFYCSDHHPQPLGVNIITTNAALREIS